MAIAAGGPRALGSGRVSLQGWLQLQTAAHAAVGALGQGRGGQRSNLLRGGAKGHWTGLGRDQEAAANESFQRCDPAGIRCHCYQRVGRQGCGGSISATPVAPAICSESEGHPHRPTPGHSNDHLDTCEKARKMMVFLLIPSFLASHDRSGDCLRDGSKSSSSGFIKTQESQRMACVACHLAWQPTCCCCPST